MGEFLERTSRLEETGNVKRLNGLKRTYDDLVKSEYPADDDQAKIAVKLSWNTVQNRVLIVRKLFGTWRHSHPQANLTDCLDRMWAWARQECDIPVRQEPGKRKKMLSYNKMECLPSWKRLQIEIRAAGNEPGFSCFDDYYKVWRQDSTKAAVMMRSSAAENVVDTGPNDSESSQSMSTTDQAGRLGGPDTDPMSSNESSDEGGDLHELNNVTPPPASRREGNSLAGSEGAVAANKSAAPDPTAAATLAPTKKRTSAERSDEDRASDHPTTPPRGREEPHPAAVVTEARPKSKRSAKAATTRPSDSLSVEGLATNIVLTSGHDQHAMTPLQPNPSDADHTGQMLLDGDAEGQSDGDEERHVRSQKRRRRTRHQPSQGAPNSPGHTTTSRRSDRAKASAKDPDIDLGTKPEVHTVTSVDRTDSPCARFRPGVGANCRERETARGAVQSRDRKA